MKNSLFFICCAVFSLFLTSCGNDATETVDQTTHTNSEQAAHANNSVDDEPKNLEDALNQVTKALGNDDAKDVKVVNFRELQSHLPERINGMKRINKEGQTSGFAGYKVSIAEATYRRNDETVDITIADTGGLGMAMMGLAAWSTLEVDKEDENSYERTTTLNGNKAYIEYNKRKQSGQVSMIVKDRFVISATGDGVDMRELEKMVKGFNL